MKTLSDLLEQKREIERLAMPPPVHVAWILVPWGLAFVAMIVMFFFCGCSPYAFQDWGDGRGTRGLMGYPIGEAYVAALAAQQPYYPRRYDVPAYLQYNPLYAPVFHPHKVAPEPSSINLYGY